jgi:hypothetical protein
LDYEVEEVRFRRLAWCYHFRWLDERGMDIKWDVERRPFERIWRTSFLQCNRNIQTIIKCSSAVSRCVTRLKWWWRWGRKSRTPIRIQVCVNRWGVLMRIVSIFLRLWEWRLCARLWHTCNWYNHRGFWRSSHFCFYWSGLKAAASCTVIRHLFTGSSGDVGCLFQAGELWSFDRSGSGCIRGREIGSEIWVGVALDVTP